MKLVMNGVMKVLRRITVEGNKGKLIKVDRWMKKGKWMKVERKMNNRNRMKKCEVISMNERMKETYS